MVGNYSESDLYHLEDTREDPRNYEEDYGDSDEWSDDDDNGEADYWYDRYSDEEE